MSLAEGSHITQGTASDVMSKLMKDIVAEDNAEARAELLAELDVVKKQHDNEFDSYINNITKTMSMLDEIFMQNFICTLCFAFIVAHKWLEGRTNSS